ncbi:MAG: phosphoribosylformylglycinamidine synthase [Deltaproteobacteria bacterium RIFCSPLOWO2_02_FULL_50_16]|nr:MAG: phosphoribosylformylglycinamidine synthase [Deltaproteobacteria bacterium GWA2_50_8]OGQ29412.1 MAG: phosphoribosylformylglycinamidine synthase [Deltaproteobacteria bacterium RIFCSPHIGHO2_02_FULL_50_15]OGQ56063.1 MAG: phosphoribosylformylglycinamidine synthase [Deltaproteobacteria bacterium RIFCSPLOWO2_02_FULL_50_16]OGQ65721.1 MAG: phosphoribosylformylglycinamidine synthase [Deltaproteobacteria bacterium RIFCSPLOWO2_12_FULL_50_11]
MKVKAYITLKEGVLDPQGKAVEHALLSLGFQGVSGVRVGKYITFDIQVRSEAQARDQVEKMCQKLLANTTIESYQFEIIQS